MSSISKSAADRQKRVLTELLALPGNNVCADCQSPAPRWASWNLGIFLCVQCATAHRKLGSHISKVKSVTLDTWTKEQVESMKNMGNTKANELYNPDPLRNPPPTNMEDGERDSEIETYIRNKYQYKAFMKREPAKEKSSSSSILRSDPPSSSSTSRRPPDVRTNRTTPLKVGTVPNPGPNIREAIEAVSPSASSFLSEMQSHTRELQMGNRDRARSTPPNAAVAKSGGRPSTATEGFEFTSVGVTPSGPSSSGRPSTATGGLGLGRVPSITTTPPAASAAAKGRAVTMGGGFSWGSGPSASTGAATSTAASAVPATTQPASVAAPTATPSTSAPTTTTAPPPAPPQRELSLFEQDLMSLQMGTTNPTPSNPPLAPSLPATNPFPMGYTNGAQGPLSTSPPPFANGMNTTQSPFGTNAFSPATSPLAGSMGGAMPGGMNNVQSLTTGFAGMTMGGTGLGPSNPFGAQSPSQGLGASSPFGSIPPQPTGGMSFTQTNPFGAMQSPPAMNSSPFGQMQPTGAPYQPSSSPFQPSASPYQQPSSSPFQPSPSPFQAGMLQTQQPTGLSTSPFGGGGMQNAFQPSPFQTQQTQGSFQSANSPFQQQQQPQFTGMSQASTFSNASSAGSGGAGFAAFAQGMLPKAPGQQQVMGQGSFNPFLQQQQQQSSGTMGWMG
ncbi:hypothetical protein FRC04_003838 [Tulasnella sp. 424]|nr:hypothetical protein FRC04_003838 [Tulasnella sp. 424]KAG8975336.1 hypothetical protein FRC05_005895 [Tulasnella sp. 425]